MKTLLTGKPYTNAAETDLRKTFSRIRRQLQREQSEREAVAAEAQRKVRRMVAK